MKYKSIFISDLHLGIKSVDPEPLRQFLKDNEYENLFLVGDIIDLWKLRRSWYWPESSNKFLRLVLKKSQKVNTVYLTGNHDEFLRIVSNLDLGSIKIRDEYIYESNGKRILLVHGDLFDSIVKHRVKIARLGAIGYELLLRINVVSNFVRRRLLFKKSHWSLSAFIKGKVKNAVKYINSFEQSIAEYARKKNCDTVIAGHIHKAEIKDINGVQYVNCGDFVESLTIAVEHIDGKIEIVKLD